MRRSRCPSRSLPFDLLLCSLFAAIACQHGLSLATAADPNDAGEPSSGLQLRVIPVAPGSDEQQPDTSATPVADYATPQDLTLVAELKNVSDRPIRLVGVRYGTGVTPPWPGKSNTSTFGPLLFRYRFRTEAGDLVEPPMVRANGEQFLEISSARVEVLAPGEAFVCQLRPLAKAHEAGYWLKSGAYSLEVHYAGVSVETAATIDKHWPHLKFGGVWNGDAISAAVAVRFAESGTPELVWGQAPDGLEAAIEFRDERTHRPKDQPIPSNEFPIGAVVETFVHVRNASRRTISFWTEDWRQGDQLTLIDAAGESSAVSAAWYSGWSGLKQMTLEPGQVAVLHCGNVGLFAEAGEEERAAHPVLRKALVLNGKFTARMTLNFGSLRTKAADGSEIPGPGDFSGSLVTGDAPLVVRARRPDDDPPTFTGIISFRAADSAAIPGGFAVVREVGGVELFKGDFLSATLEVPNCTGKSFYVSVRIPGFEEQTFYDVVVAPNAPARLDLRPSQSARMRLIDRMGRPVAGARVRYFNRSKAQASTGPYPTQGTEGDLWATSDPAGVVVLDTLQKIDPQDSELGENIYWFYIDAPSLAPRFVGPLRAGQDLGEVTLGPLLEIKGTVRGTAEELANFAAEWDQPEAMLRGDGTGAWDYAESQPLMITRDGESVTFHLTGLRPGRLRFVSNFGKDPKSVTHEFRKRVAAPTDVVLEIELTESRDDIVLENRPPGEQR